MSQPEIEPLAPELLRLLQVEKTRPDASEDMQARVLARMGGDLLASTPWSGSPDAGQLGPASTPRISSWRLHRLTLAVGLLGLGGLGGAGLHAWIAGVSPPPVSVPAPVAAPALLPGPDAAESSGPGTVAPPAPASKSPQARRSPALTHNLSGGTAPLVTDERDRQLARDRGLAAERALLEQARTALARGKPGDALVLLERHQREFEHGRLGEEREALVILSLAADQKRALAQRLADEFRRKYPASMLQRAIDAALELPR